MKPQEHHHRVLQLPKGTVICTAVTAAECDQYLAPLVSYASAMVKSRASETNALAIGFDAEFRQDKSSRRGPKKSKVESAETGGVFRREDTVALVQIAFPRDPTHGLNGDVVVLIRLSSIGKVLPKSLETILVPLSCSGVGVAQDLRLGEAPHGKGALIVDGSFSRAGCGSGGPLSRRRELDFVGWSNDFASLEQHANRCHPIKEAMSPPGAKGQSSIYHSQENHVVKGSKNTVQQMGNLRGSFPGTDYLCRRGCLCWACCSARRTMLCPKEKP